MIQAPIPDTALQNHLDRLEKDGLHIFIAADGLFRGGLFHGTRFVNQLRAQHRLGLLETMVLGQASLCAALMIQTMKGRETLQLRYETNGSAKGFAVEADSTGFVRGYLLQNPIPLEAPIESWDLAPFFGTGGTISVSRFLHTPAGTHKELHKGVVEIKYRNIAKDLSWYFHQSEQINTAFNTSIRFDVSGNVIGAGGFFIQKMPAEGGSLQHKKNQTEDEHDSLTIKMERAFSACPPLGDWFGEGGNTEDIIFGLLREFTPQSVATRNIVFDCPCSKDYYRAIITKLPPAELEALKRSASDPIEITCRNCSSVYSIPLKEI